MSTGRIRLVLHNPAQVDQHPAMLGRRELPARTGGVTWILTTVTTLLTLWAASSDITPAPLHARCRTTTAKHNPCRVGFIMKFFRQFVLQSFL